MMLIRLSLTRLEWFLARSRPSEDNDCTVTRHSHPVLDDSILIRSIIRMEKTRERVKVADC